MAPRDRQRAAARVAATPSVFGGHRARARTAGDAGPVRPCPALPPATVWWPAEPGGTGAGTDPCAGPAVVGRALRGM
ncbi:hypothetical protein G6F23_015824 [Rhizopus arrhizus]|nr:hypothetical protein G6F23_015824 [Rhizopus arrhizus]